MRLYAASTALLGWFALILQFYLLIKNAPSDPMAILAATVTYLSFFTILTNLLVAMVLTFQVWRTVSSSGEFFERPTVQTATATYIAIVGVTYAALLRQLWDPTGAQKLADVLLHDAIPILYIVYWLLWGAKRKLRWRDAATWLVYPGLYLLYVLIRGAASGHYPYPFVDVTKLGYARALGNIGLFVIFFLGVGLSAIAIGRRLRSNP